MATALHGYGSVTTPSSPTFGTMIHLGTNSDSPVTALKPPHISTFHAT
jgi:hypothetical protein